MVERRYWQIGRKIVEELQGGDESAGYGKKVLSDLSAKLQGRYSKGFSVTNLRYFRLFYQVYSDRTPVIRHKLRDESLRTGKDQEKHHKACDVLDELSRAIEKSDTIHRNWSRPCLTILNKYSP